MPGPSFAKALLIIMTMGLLSEYSLGQDKSDTTKKFVPSDACIEVLRSNCNASQQELLNELLQKLDIYGVGNQVQHYPGNPPAFEALPKDEHGLINWVKAFNQGIIKPRSSLADVEDKTQEGFFDNIIFMQVKVHIMADVAFPHGMHSYWLNCDSCHPKPFNDVNGSNNMKMDKIFDGKWCGKCHGKVAFSTKAYTNCRRCHVLPKKPLGH